MRNHIKSIYFLTLACVGILLLPGCGGRGVMPAETVLSEGWRRVSQEDSASEPPLYCYKTLGNVECYSTPDERRKGELVTTYPIHKKDFTKKRYQGNQTPTHLKPKHYESALEATEYKPSLEQQDYEYRMRAYSEAQEQVGIAKAYDDRMFAAEAAEERRKQEELKRALKTHPKQNVVAEAPQKRTVSEIMSVLRGEKTLAEVKADQAKKAEKVRDAKKAKERLQVQLKEADNMLASLETKR